MGPIDLFQKELDVNLSRAIRCSYFLADLIRARSRTPRVISVICGFIAIWSYPGSCCALLTSDYG